MLPALRVAANIACPTNIPTDGSRLNVGVAPAELAKSLVPISASHARACRYSVVLKGASASERLIGSGVLGESLAAQLAAQTNRLPSVPPTTGPGCFPVARTYIVIFALGPQQVDVSENECKEVSNGWSYRAPTAKWLNELALYTAEQPKRHE
ncbi:MAG: hypothetical protein ACLPVY_10640 [Acidimicrobiia bacterium]